MNWFYARNKEQLGPVDDAQFDNLVQTGAIGPDTLVWHEGMPSWQPYATLPKSPAALSGDSAICVECGQTFPKGEMIHHGQAWVCSGCKPVFLQKISEGVEISTGGLRYAGFWIRFCAKFVDGIILLVALFVPLMLIFGMTGMLTHPERQQSSEAIIIQLVWQLGYIAINAAYSIFFVGKYGATPGKMACKLKVVDADGSPIGFGRATGRFFAEILSGLICYIGYLMVAFDPEKRALHDRICNTRVIYK